MVSFLYKTTYITKTSSPKLRMFHHVSELIFHYRSRETPDAELEHEVHDHLWYCTGTSLSP